MIHILLTILKIILIIIAVILGLLLLAAVILLFDPVRYRAEVSKAQEASLTETTGAAEISWLFGILKVCVCYEKGKTSFAIRIFGSELGKKKSKKKKKAKKRSTSPPSGEKKPAQKPNKPEKPAAVPELTEEPKIQKEPQKKPDLNSEKKSDIKPEGKSDAQEKPAAVPEFREEPKLIEEPDKHSGRSLSDILEKIKNTAGSIHAKIKGLVTNAERVRNILGDPAVQETIALLWKTAKGLIRHVLPTKTEGSLTFGLSDPSATGMILGVAGMSWPLHKNSVELHPVWDTEGTIYGNIKLRGRIYGIVAVIYALKLILNKNVRRSISKLRNRGK